MMLGCGCTSAKPVVDEMPPAGRQHTPLEEGSYSFVETLVYSSRGLAEHFLSRSGVLLLSCELQGCFVSIFRLLADWLVLGLSCIPITWIRPCDIVGHLSLPVLIVETG